MPKVTTVTAEDAVNTSRGNSRVCLDIVPKSRAKRMAQDYIDDPVNAPAVVLVDITRPTFEERIFAQVRFIVTDQDGEDSKLNDDWKQANTINFPALNTASLKRCFRDLYRGSRDALGLTPPTPV